MNTLGNYINHPAGKQAFIRYNTDRWKLDCVQHQILPIIASVVIKQFVSYCCMQAFFSYQTNYIIYYNFGLHVFGLYSLLFSSFSVAEDGSRLEFAYLHNRPIFREQQLQFTRLVVYCGIFCCQRIFFALCKRPLYVGKKETHSNNHIAYKKGKKTSF